MRSSAHSNVASLGGSSPVLLVSTYALGWDRAAGLVPHGDAFVPHSMDAHRTERDTGHTAVASPHDSGCEHRTPSRPTEVASLPRRRIHRLSDPRSGREPTYGVRRRRLVPPSKRGASRQRWMLPVLLSPQQAGYVPWHTTCRREERREPSFARELRQPIGVRQLLSASGASPQLREDGVCVDGRWDSASSSQINIRHFTCTYKLKVVP